MRVDLAALPHCSRAPRLAARVVYLRARFFWGVGWREKSLAIWAGWAGRPPSHLAAGDATLSRRRVGGRFGGTPALTLGAFEGLKRSLVVSAHAWWLVADGPSM